MSNKIERIIQYYGLLRIPAFESRVKWWRLYADIIRAPESEYYNAKYPNPQGFFGYVQAITSNRVERTYTLQYRNQILDSDADINLFIQQNISCALEAILTSFANLGAFQGGIVFERNNPIKDWSDIQFIPDEFRIRLYTPNTVFRFTWEYDVNESCTVPGSKQPPPPPPKPNNILPNELPTNANDNLLPPISPAYNGIDDLGFTYNPSPNNVTNLPIGTAGETYRVYFQYDQQDSSGNIIGNGEVNAQAVPAPITAYGLSQDLTNLGSSAPGGYVLGTRIDGTQYIYTSGFGFPGGFRAANLRNLSITKN